MYEWALREQTEIKLDEGLRLVVYKDTVGLPTVGYGHMDPALKVGDKISLQEAYDLFAPDFEDAITAAKWAVPFFENLDGPRKGAMVNMAFNLGAKGLAGFHGTLAALDEQDWDSAAQHVMNSKYARQTKSRAARIAYRIRTGNYALR